MSESPELPEEHPDENPTDPVESQATTPVEELDDVSRLVQEKVEAEQRALRAQAELENFRKRTQRSMDEERKYAALPFLRDLLPVVDNLQRAVTAAEQEGTGSDLVQGVKMVCLQLDGVMEQHQCRTIDALGQPFDPNLHEAIGQQPSDEIPTGNVCQVMQSGYQLHDRVVRPAQVFVSTGPAAN